LLLLHLPPLQVQKFTKKVKKIIKRKTGKKPREQGRDPKLQRRREKRKGTWCGSVICLMLVRHENTKGQIATLLATPFLFLSAAPTRLSRSPRAWLSAVRSICVIQQSRTTTGHAWWTPPPPRVRIRFIPGTNQIPALGTLLIGTYIYFYIIKYNKKPENKIFFKGKKGSLTCTLVLGRFFWIFLKNRRFWMIRISSKWITINFKTINMSMIKLKKIKSVFLENPITYPACVIYPTVLKVGMTTNPYS
jgi:hypothetical protein